MQAVWRKASEDIKLKNYPEHIYAYSNNDTHELIINENKDAFVTDTVKYIREDLVSK